MKVDIFVHLFHVYHGVAKSDLIFLKGKSLYCFDCIFFVIPNRFINILRYKTLTYVLDIDRPQIFTIKIE